MDVLLPPDLPDFKSGPYYFLAGSIDMGKAENWQSRVAGDLKFFDGTILNPRRADFDPDLRQSPDEPKFLEQVEWELTCLENCDGIFLYLDPKGKAPVTMLELGKFHDKITAVCCPKGFWREGNIEIFCTRYGVPFTRTYDAFLDKILEKIGQ